MRFLRCLSGLLAALLSVALLSSSAPADSRGAGSDPLATTVTGACAGGPGRLSLTVHPPAGGRFRVDVTARGLVNGSRWAVEVVQEGDETSRVKDFGRVAVDGRWTVTTHFPATREAFINSFAQQRGDRGTSCFVLTLSGRQAVGASTCNNDRAFVGLFARERDDGSTVVRSLIFSARRDSRWHHTLTATGAQSRQMVEFNDLADRGGVVDSRVVFTGVRDPQLRLMASNKDRGRCFIRLDPPNVATSAPLNLEDLGKLNAFRASR